MALVNWCEVWGRTFNEDRSGKKTGTKVYLVTFDADVTLLSQVLADAQAETGFPQYGDEYDPESLTSYTLGLVATSFTPKEYDEQQNRVFLIEVGYENSEIDLGSPTLRPWTVTWGSIKEQIVPDKTLFNSGTIFPVGAIKAVALGEPITNSVGDYFDPPVLSTKVMPTVTFQKNFSQITDLGSIASVTDLMSRIGTVNEDVITIGGIDFDIFQGKIEDINMSWQRENGEKFYNISITISYNEEYNVAKVLNAGYNKTVGANKTEQIKLKDGTIPSNPQLLDAAGAWIDGTPAAKKAAAIYYAFGVDRLSDFGDLGLPANEAAWD